MKGTLLHNLYMSPNCPKELEFISKKLKSKNSCGHDDISSKPMKVDPAKGIVPLQMKNYSHI